MTLPQIVMMLMQMVVAVPMPMVVLCGKYGLELLMNTLYLTCLEKCFNCAAL